MKRGGLLILLLGVVLLLFFFANGKTGVKYRWDRVSYSITDNQPFGCALTYKLLPDVYTEGVSTFDRRNTVFKNEGFEEYELFSVEDYSEPVDAIYTDEYDEPEEDNDHVVDYSGEEIGDDDDETPAADGRNYIIVTRDFVPDDTEVKSILYHAKNGNSVLIASENFTSTLRNYLDFTTSDYILKEKNDSTSLNFADKPFKKEYNYKFHKTTVDNHFNAVGAKTKVLARNNQWDPVFIQVPVGSGNVFLCSTPRVFTNVYTTDSINREFVEVMLSHLPDVETVWVSENYYDRYNNTFNPDNNPFEDRNDEENQQGLLDFIWENPPLQWAFWLILGSVLLYFLFRAKRRQKAIPVVQPIQNSTIEFVKIIGELYFQKGDHKNLASKKISYFLEYIRSGFYVKTHEFTPEMIEKVSERSGISNEKVAEVFTYISVTSKKQHLSQVELLKLTNLLEEFKNQSNI